MNKAGNKRKPLILLTNDDGINSRGLAALSREMRSLGEVVIVAPDSERSAAGHAITLTEPLRAEKIYKNGTFYGYAVNGTPADAVKVAVLSLLEKKPDLVVSGINRGPNTGTNVIYSGTVSAATEAAILGLKAIAISLGSFADADYTPAAAYARRLGKEILDRSLPPGVLLNVNVPAIAADEIRGIKVVHQGIARFREVMEKREDLRGRPYFWLGGELDSPEEDRGSDNSAVNDNYIAVTPLHYDMTDYTFLKELKSWDCW